MGTRCRRSYCCCQKPVLTPLVSIVLAPNFTLHPEASADLLTCFQSIDSTMDEARRRVGEGIHRRLWIAASEQTAGRGRHGREWVSPPGNLHMTLLTPAPCALRDQAKIGFAIGVALHAGVSECIGDLASLKIKWPNDLLMNSAKVSGLLLEGLDQGRAIAIGMGLNIEAHPPHTPYPAAHLQQIVPGVTAAELFTAITGAVTRQLATFADGCGFPLIRQRWLARAAHKGHRITVRLPDGEATGDFKDIDSDGALILATDAGVRRIDAGDVFPLDK
jgi:BirA family transcriptional regulator, biotin operon repressor / biotin---[acetyl-CoA-carboxylase] ligase